MDRCYRSAVDILEAMGRPFFAYLLGCSDNSYYVGHTDDLARRIHEHQAGGRCTYTTVRRPVVLLWSQEFPSREEAKKVEAQIKGWSRAKKEALARGDFATLRAAARKDWPAYHARRVQAAGPSTRRKKSGCS
jgi:tRNA/rRNA methyltransferase